MIHFSDDASAVEFVAAESRWKVNLTTYLCEKIQLQPGDPRPLIELPGPQVQALDAPVASQDGKWEAIIRKFQCLS